MSEVKPTLKPYAKQILMCTGPNCAPDKAPELYKYLKKRLVEKGLYNNDDKRIARASCHCFGVCQSGPILVVQPDGVWYHSIDESKLEEILTSHIEGGQPVEKYTFYKK